MRPRDGELAKKSKERSIVGISIERTQIAPLAKRVLQGFRGRVWISGPSPSRTFDDDDDEHIGARE